MAPSIANIARFTLFIGTAVASVRAALCESPGIRREWRALSTNERAEWIEAVNVRFFSSISSVILEIKSTGSVCRRNLAILISLQLSQQM